LWAHLGCGLHGLGPWGPASGANLHDTPTTIQFTDEAFACRLPTIARAACWHPSPVERVAKLPRVVQENIACNAWTNIVHEGNTGCSLCLNAPHLGWSGRAVQPAEHNTNSSVGRLHEHVPIIICTAAVAAFKAAVNTTHMHAPVPAAAGRLANCS
jgi:hypothetical protein